MNTSRYTLTQYLDFIKPLFNDTVNHLMIHKEKLVDKPEKSMSRDKENISPMMVGMIVDVLTRAQLMMTSQGHFPLREALCQVNPAAPQLISNVALRLENKLLDQVKEPGWETVIILHTVLHGLAHWRLDRRPRCVRPNRKTVYNILYMVDISVTYLSTLPGITTGVTLTAPCFSKLYPASVDYVSQTGLWDMVVSENEPYPTKILKLIAYDILAFDMPEYKEREFLEVGIINPRLEHRYWIHCKSFPVDAYDALRHLLKDPSSK